MQKKSNMSLPIAIIGGGIAGLSVAYHLVRTGKTVHIYHHQPQGTISASEAALGVATLKGVNFARSGLFHSKVQGHRALKQLLTALNIKWHSGVIEPFLSVDAYKKQSIRIYKREPRGLYYTHRHSTHASDFECFYSYPDDFVYSPSSLLCAMKNFVLQKNGNNRFFQQFAKPIYQDSRWLVGERVYSCVVLCVGDALPSMLASLGLTLAIKSHFTYGGVFSWREPKEASQQKLAVFSKQDVSSMFAYKLGSKALVGRRVLHHNQLCAGAMDSKRSQEALNCEYCVTATRTLRVERMCKQCLQAYTFFKKQEVFGLFAWNVASNKSVLHEGLHWHSARRLSLYGHKPVIGPVYFRDKTRHLTQEYSRKQEPSPAPLWLLGGLHKSGYYLAPYLAAKLVEAMVYPKFSPLFSYSKAVSHLGVWEAKAVCSQQ